MTPRTNFQYFHWVAVDDDTYDGPGSPLGIGRTEQEAIEDLREQLAERDERIAGRRRRLELRYENDLNTELDCCLQKLAKAFERITG